MPVNEDKQGYMGVMHPTVLAWMEYRAQQFQKATQKKGQPLTYGAAKKEVKG